MLPRPRQYANTLALPESFFSTSVGFDRLFDDLVQHTNQSGGYPPYNLISLGDDEYQIDLAVAGFKQDDLDIEIKDGLLTVTGNQNRVESDSVQFLHRGIAARNFQRTFSLAEHVTVQQASMDNGILTISLKREIPESRRAKKIALTVK